MQANQAVTKRYCKSYTALICDSINHFIPLLCKSHRSYWQADEKFMPHEAPVHVDHGFNVAWKFAPQPRT
eukprot:2448140-Amphidinium_carterae.1